MARLREGRRQRRDAWAKRPDSHAPALPHGVGSTCERKPPQACGSITHTSPKCKPANPPMMQNGNATALAYRHFMNRACIRIQRGSWRVTPARCVGVWPLMCWAKQINGLDTQRPRRHGLGANQVHNLLYPRNRGAHPAACDFMLTACAGPWSSPARPPY